MLDIQRDVKRLRNQPALASTVHTNSRPVRARAWKTCSAVHESCSVLTATLALKPTAGSSTELYPWKEKLQHVVEDVLFLIYTLSKQKINPITTTTQNRVPWVTKDKEGRWRDLRSCPLLIQSVRCRAVCTVMHRCVGTHTEAAGGFGSCCYLQ